MLPFVFAVIYFPYTILETYLVVRKVNEYKAVHTSMLEYSKSWIYGIVTNFVVICAIIFITEQKRVDIFIIVICVFALIFPWFQTYMYGISTKGEEIILYKNLLKQKYNIECSAAMYVFSGKLTKNANAYVTNLLTKKRIMISDYLIENLSEDEICAILSHEVSHCENRDTEFNVVFVNFISLILIILGYSFELWNMPIIPGCLIAISTIVVWIIAFMAIRRNQEYRADKYVVDKIGDYKTYVNALVRIHDLNCIPKKKNKFLALFESHPQLEKRIQKLSEYARLGK